VIAEQRTTCVQAVQFADCRAGGVKRACTVEPRPNAPSAKPAHAAKLTVDTG
jgi:hypothetical protein